MNGLATDKLEIDLRHGDSRELIKAMPDCSVDAVVTDPPYELRILGRAWDGTGVAFDAAFWRDVWRVLKPGGHVLACGGPRTAHRLTCAIEDAGFEIRDTLAEFASVETLAAPLLAGLAPAQREALARLLAHLGFGGALAWLYGTGWPKHGVRELVVERAGGEPGEDGAEGLAIKGGVTLKPAHEPIVLARRPLSEPTVAANVLKWGVGLLQVDRCRVGTEDPRDGATPDSEEPPGRWPANVIIRHDGRCVRVAESPAEIWACVPACPVRLLDAQSGETVAPSRVLRRTGARRLEGFGFARSSETRTPGRDGGASRLFYCAKPNERERGEENRHPTVKPLALVRYLVRLVTPPGGLVLDPFMGSGTTGVACVEEGLRFVGMDIEADYVEVARERIRRAEAARASREPLFASRTNADADTRIDQPDLFAWECA